MGDLVWALLPLWILAACELARLLTGFSGNRWAPFAQALVVFTLLVLFWLNLLGLAGTIIDLQASAMRLGLLAGLLGLIAILSLLVGMGWSWDAARLGFVWGVCAAMGLYGLSAMWHATQLRAPGQYELWQPVPEARNADLLSATVRDLSEWNTGLTDEIDLTLADELPSLRWEALREMKKLVQVPADQGGCRQRCALAGHRPLARPDAPPGGELPRAGLAGGLRRGGRALCRPTSCAGLPRARRRSRSSRSSSGRAAIFSLANLQQASPFRRASRWIRAALSNHPGDSQDGRRRQRLAWS